MRERRSWRPGGPVAGRRRQSRSRRSRRGADALAATGTGPRSAFVGGLDSLALAALPGRDRRFESWTAAPAAGAGGR